MDLGENFRQEGRYEEAAKVLEETVRTKNEAVPKEEYIVIWLNLGFVYFRMGELDKSRRIFLDNLSEIQIFNRSIYEFAYCLLGLTAVVVAMGQPQVAAKLLGALEIHKESLIFWTTDRSEYERIVAAVKAQLPDKQFIQLYQEGQALSLVEAARLIQNQGIKEKSRDAERLDQLTKRETEILFLVAHGLSDVQIAERLVLSPRTVNAHLTSIYRKLGVNSRSAATRYAIEHGLG
jgi:DNA-binding CsgD family transcriptional regulator